MKPVRRQYTRCPNCDFPLLEKHKYCPHCGQENHDLNIPLRLVIEEFAEHIFHFDTKSVKTIKTLLFKPGLLTLEFMRGKRVNFVPPIRLYLVISVVFFFLLSFSTGREAPDDSNGTEGARSSAVKSSRLNLTFFGINSAELQGMQRAQLDSLMDARSIQRTSFNSYVVRQLARIGATEKSEFGHLLMKAISYMMFVLMPVFALVVFLFYRKDAQHYLGTLVFSIHYHSFMFLALSLLILINRFTGWWYMLLLPLILFPIYLFAALRRVYNNSIIWTAIKMLVTGILQVVVMMALFLLTAAISVLIF